jgi:hypothetical protein
MIWPHRRGRDAAIFFGMGGDQDEAGSNGSVDSLR